jgi:ABC-type dipeptide/oligopeptide/nickel transport system permease subunit
VAAVLAPWVSPYRHDEIHPLDALLAPTWRYPLGTDDLGRDVLSRVVHGARVSLAVGVIAIGISSVSGVALGLAAGYWGGRLDALLMRVMDALLAFPAILLAIALMAVLGPSLQNAMVAIGIIYIPAFARITRANVLSLREKEFVEAARALGAGAGRILARHVLVNVASPILVLATVLVARFILTESAISFLGLGVAPPATTWGAMIGEGRKYLFEAWWATALPGAAIVFAVLVANFAGDRLRDAFDPYRLRHTEGAIR